MISYVGVAADYHARALFCLRHRCEIEKFGTRPSRPKVAFGLTGRPHAEATLHKIDLYESKFELRSSNNHAEVLLDPLIIKCFRCARTADSRRSDVRLRWLAAATSTHRSWRRMCICASSSRPDLGSRS